MTNSVLLSIFRRKGGEGEFTFIINDQNRDDCLNKLESSEKSETALICYHRNDSNWLIITEKGVLASQFRDSVYISFNDLVSVRPALNEEFRNGVRSKEEFTLLELKTRTDSAYVVGVEKGRPYAGIYQVLHYVARNS
jgi:hypothetical protein